MTRYKIFKTILLSSNVTYAELEDDTIYVYYVIGGTSERVCIEGDSEEEASRTFHELLTWLNVSRVGL